MSAIPSAMRGPLFMVIATGSYVASDTFMKLATEGLPPYEVVLVRGIWAAIWGMPLLLALGYGRLLPKMFDRRVLLRNLLEVGAILSYIIALTNMPISDSSAIGQITPLLVLVGASLLFGERVGVSRALLIALGFLGALMVAQPSLDGVSVYALMALATAVFSAGRDMASRGVAIAVPGMVVAMSAVCIVIVGAGAMHLATETWVLPTLTHLTYLAGAGLLLVSGHFFIFMAYRIGPMGVVAPFFYSFSVWAVISALLVFGHVPNALAAAGIALIIASGLTIVLLDQRRRRALEA